MVNINIITPFGKPTFLHQLPDDLGGFSFFENGDDSREYDMVVVYEGLSKEKTVICDPHNLLFISGEPPMSRVYTNQFLAQFNHVISSHKSLKHPNNIQSQQALPWHLGVNYKDGTYKYDFNQFVNLGLPPKMKKMSIIASNKTMMPGHGKRFAFVDELRRRFEGLIDFYGKGINPINDKGEAILPYYMTICIENSSIDNYWTEKIADAYLGYSIPVYYGCSNIDTYFPSASIERIDINRPQEAIGKIETLLNNCEKIYEDKFDALVKARNLLIYEYNLYYVLAKFYNEHCNGRIDGRKSQSQRIIPNELTRNFKLSYALLRLKRAQKKWLI